MPSTPLQPQGADKHLVLGNCPKWVLEWPKTQIRLGGGIEGLKHRSTGATSKRQAPIVRPSKPAPKPVGKEPAQEAADATTSKAPPVVANTRKEPPVIARKAPPVIATTSRHQKLLLGMSVLQEPSKAKDVANNEDNNEDNINVNDFLNTCVSKDLHMPAMDDEPRRVSEE